MHDFSHRKVSPAKQLLIQHVGFMNSRHFFQYRSRTKHWFKRIWIFWSYQSTQRTQCSSGNKLKAVQNFYHRLLLFHSKVEKISQGSLDLIPSPSPSVKIQIMGEKVCLRCKGKTLLVVNKHLKTKSLLTSPINVLPYYSK